MKRIGLAIVLGFAAVVSLAFAFDDICAGFGTGQRLAAILVAGVCLGGLVATVIAGRFKDRPAITWGVAVLTAAAVIVVLYVLVTLMWVGDCSR